DRTALGDRARLGIGLWTAPADLRGDRRVAGRYGVGSLLDGAARSGAGLRRAHRSARGRPDQPRISRASTRPDDRQGELMAPPRDTCAGYATACGCPPGAP